MWKCLRDTMGDTRCLFRDTNANTYYSPWLIRAGVTTISQLVDLGESMQFLPPTPAPVYKDIAPRLLLPPPPPSQSVAPTPMDEASVIFWMDWNNRVKLRYLMVLSPEHPRQTPETWKEWTRLRLSDADITFIQQALWCTLAQATSRSVVGLMAAPQHSLPVGWLSGDHRTCPDTLPVSWHGLGWPNSAWAQCGWRTARRKILKILLTMPSLSLSSPLGLVMWSAVRASWRLRCSFKFDPRPHPPHWKHFLNMWIIGLEPWLEHPTRTLPHSETTMLLHGLKQLEGPEALLDHSRAMTPANPAVPPTEKAQKTGS